MKWRNSVPIFLTKFQLLHYAYFSHTCDKIHLFLRFHEEFGFSIFPANKIILVDFSTMKNKNGLLKDTNKSGVTAELKRFDTPVASLASTPVWFTWITAWKGCMFLGILYLLLQSFTIWLISLTLTGVLAIREKFASCESKWSNPFIWKKKIVFLWFFWFSKKVSLF